MGKAKGKRKGKEKRSHLLRSKSFQFRSILPFEECRDRVYRIQPKSTMLNSYSVQVYPINRNDEYETCEFRIVLSGGGVEANGQLRAGLEELTTYAEGSVGITQKSNAASAAGLAMLFGLGTIAFTQSLGIPFNTALCCIVPITLFALIAGWSYGNDHRDEMIRAIDTVLNVRDD